MASKRELSPVVGLAVEEMEVTPAHDVGVELREILIENLIARKVLLILSHDQHGRDLAALHG